MVRAEPHLSLGGGGERVPLVTRAAGGRDVSEADGLIDRHAGERRLQVPREGDASVLHQEADEGSHRDTAVLDLGVAEPADGLLGGIETDVQRVPVANGRVERLGQAGKASLGRDLIRRPRLVKVIGGKAGGLELVDGRPVEFLRHLGHRRAHGGRGRQESSGRGKHREHILLRATTEQDESRSMRRRKAVPSG